MTNEYRQTVPVMTRSVANPRLSTYEGTLSNLVLLVRVGTEDLIVGTYLIEFIIDSLTSRLPIL